MTRRHFLQLSALASAAAPPRPHVLFIAVDDLNTNIGCYGHPLVKTPNIDRLAKRGMRFERAYCNYPVCNASRTSLLSGRRPDTTRVFGNQTPPRTYLGDVVMLPEHFKANGYATARVGKIAHGLFEDAVKWDISESRAGVAHTPEKRKAKADGEGGGVPLAWRATSNADSEEPDGATARRVAGLIEQWKGKPFFIGCGFHKPHLPWVAPKKYFDMYPLDQIKLPATPANDRDDIPPIALTHNPADDALTDEQRREAIRGYYAATSFMDAQVGVVLDALDKHKLWDSTVVVLFGDHGWHLYDHLQLWRKMTVFEESAHAPLLVHAPGTLEGKTTPRLVEFVDIYPTLSELCGLPQAAGMEGQSFRPLLKNPQLPWKKAAYTIAQRGKNRFGRSIRTEQYRYTEWDGGKEGVELYDHQTDPHEWTNLARDPKANGKVEELKKLLQAQQR